MSTHNLGTGTQNLSLNFPAAEKSLLGKLAFAHGVSTGAFLKRCILSGIATDDKQSAKKIREIRLNHRQQRAGIVCLFVLFAGLFAQTDIVRTARRGGRRDDVEVCA